MLLNALSCSLILFLNSFYENVDAMQSKIVGGTNADEGQFPYQVLIFKNNTQLCGGSIVSNQWVLSAAHCFATRDPHPYTVLTGTTKMDSTNKQYEVKTVKVHEFYFGIYNDIALVQLAEKLQFNDTVQSIAIPDADTSAGTNLVLSGWGLTQFGPHKYTNNLQMITLSTISYEKCQMQYLGISSIPMKDVCTFTKVGEGACHGDSGGPLVDPEKKWQVGIVSGGISCAKGYPDFFTNVFKYKSWIESNIKE